MPPGPVHKITEQVTMPSTVIKNYPLPTGENYLVPVDFHGHKLLHYFVITVNELIGGSQDKNPMRYLFLVIAYFEQLFFWNNKLTQRSNPKRASLLSRKYINVKCSEKIFTRCSGEEITSLPIYVSVSGNDCEIKR